MKTIVIFIFILPIIFRGGVHIVRIFSNKKSRCGSCTKCAKSQKTKITVFDDRKL